MLCFPLLSSFFSRFRGLATHIKNGRVAPPFFGFIKNYIQRSLSPERNLVAIRYIVFGVYVNTQVCIHAHIFFSPSILEDFLAEPSNVFEGLFLDIQMPFQQGKGGSDYFDDLPMSFSLYFHQEKIFELLCGLYPRFTIKTADADAKTAALDWGMKLRN